MIDDTQARFYSAHTTANTHPDRSIKSLSLMKKIRLTCLPIGFLCTFSSLVFAAPIGNENLLSQAFINCDNSAQGIIEQATCLKDEAERQDARLNSTYKKLQSHLSATQKTKLVASQRIWLQSRQSDAELETTLYGQAQPDNLQTELNDIQRIAARTAQLQRYLILLQ